MKSVIVLVSPSENRQTFEALKRRLLAEREENGTWSGHLASSALSTATAVAALSVAGRRSDLVHGGLSWLEQTQNPDGGWGDTVLSVSNISTTALCWAAYLIADRPCLAVDRAARWLEQAAGSLEPKQLARTIADRYGKDRTFSVPILTVLAIAGRVPWTIVPQLPFELAACPQSWFRWLQLPVVSYALPALIAIGHVRHRSCASWNPAARGIRRVVAARTLEVLDRIQPTSGGFLEAVPLTSFVSLSLHHAGYVKSPTLQRGLRFLEASVRQDGSWPIDTNLATWVTTLSVNALRHHLPEASREAIREWLLGQQFRTVHPYTGAPPGGWAWTDLPGGVPDADDTAGALIALHHLVDSQEDDRTKQAACDGVVWLLNLQNRDGGIPTFCRGWGKLPFDRSGADLTAHALLAWTAWRSSLPPDVQQRVDSAIRMALKYLERTQRADGSWLPLWFGNQFADNDENPVYGTSRVLLALAAIAPDSEMMRLGVRWLQASQNPDGGWGGAANVPSSIEETSLALSALSTAMSPDDSVITRGLGWLVQHTSSGEATAPSPIGFYFARLWYYEQLYPLIFATDAFSRNVRGADDLGPK